MAGSVPSTPSVYRPRRSDVDIERALVIVILVVLVVWLVTRLVP